MAVNVLRDCGMLYFHFGFGLSLIVLGLFTILARRVAKLTPFHPVMGSCWFYGVLMQTATSLWCRKDGFKWFIMMFMLILVVNMIVAHASIRIYQRNKKKLEDNHVELSSLAAQDKQEQQTVRPVPKVYGLPLVYYKNIHGLCMCLAYAMLFGAGVMFTRRSKDLANCIDMYSPDDAVVAGAVFYRKDGALWIGGADFVPPS